MSVDMVSTFCSAHVVRFGTWHADDAIKESLQEWQAKAAEGERRSVKQIDDYNVVSVLWQIDFQGHIDMDDLGSRLNQRNVPILPDTPAMGESTIVVLKAEDRAEAAQIAKQTVFGSTTDLVTGGDWLPDVELYMAGADECLLLVADPCEDVDRRLGAELYGPLRLAETMNHKITGQYEEYEREFRSELLASAKQLKQQLRTLGDDLESHPPSTTADVGRSFMTTDNVLSAFSRAVSAVSPVRQIRAMLHANQQNVKLLVEGNAPNSSGGLALSRRSKVSLQCVAQVEADLGLIDPLLDAGQWLGHVQQGRMLAALGVSESRENKQRDRDQRQSEYRNRLLAGVGIWIGLGAIWSTAVSSLPETLRPTTFFRHMAWQFSLPFAGLLTIIVLSILLRPTR